MQAGALLATVFRRPVQAVRSQRWRANRNKTLTGSRDIAQEIAACVDPVPMG